MLFFHQIFLSLSINFHFHFHCLTIWSVLRVLNQNCTVSLSKIRILNSIVPFLPIDHTVRINVFLSYLILAVHHNIILTNMVEMAESIDLSKLRKRLECGICLNVVCRPKALVCNHSFCKRCLDKILRFSPNGAAIIKCPNGCKTETFLSSTQTTNDLEINFMLKSVLDLLAGQIFEVKEF